MAPPSTNTNQRRALSRGVCLVLLTFVGAATAGEDRDVSFVNDVVPVLTKAGCNAGSCHAKANGGQNGFELSLFGFEPADDYESLVKQARGRRISLAAPQQSLLLRKAAGRVPHGGGVRLKRNSVGYEVIRRWVEQGAAFAGPDEPVLSGIEVRPREAVVAMNGQQELKVLANYSDNTSRDVTEFAVFESNVEAMADVSANGLVTVHDVPGNAAVMIRYGTRSTVFSASVPLGAPVDRVPEAKNFLDEHVFANLKQIGIPPSGLADDATFLRRVTLDITGRLPTLKEATDFAASTESDKRELAIERLLKTPQYADYFAAKWTPLLKNRRDDASDITSNLAFHAWIRDSLLANVSYDQIVRELLAATGTVVGNPPVAWYKRVKDPKQQLEDVAQLFLGVRMQCAQCHHHPFERWSQDDYYSFAAFFTRVGRKPTGTRGEDLIFHKRGIATAKNVKSGEDLRPAALGDDVGQITADQDPRLKLADWMSLPENPFFARALVNRYWKHFFRRGLIEPEDDIRDTNPPTNPALLAALQKHFIESGFDLKELVRVITRSNTYQLSAQPNEHNLVDRQNYSRFYTRRLPAEVLLDAVDDATGSPTRFASLPPGTRAVALPDNSYNKSSEFLRVFGRPESQSVCECERVQSSNLAQSLHLINSREIKRKLGSGSGRAAQLAKAGSPIEDKVVELYLTTLSRRPTANEVQTAVAYLNEPVLDAKGKPLDGKKATQQNFQDLIWALLNTKEFLFNH